MCVCGFHCCAEISFCLLIKKQILQRCCLSIYLAFSKSFFSFPWIIIIIQRLIESIFDSGRKFIRSKTFSFSVDYSNHWKILINIRYWKIFFFVFIWSVSNKQRLKIIIFKSIFDQKKKKKEFFSLSPGHIFILSNSNRGFS